MALAVNSASQGKLLTDIFCRCIELSRAATQLPEPQRRTIVEPLIIQHLRETSLDLNAVWTALLHEPGVTERALASAAAALEDLAPLLRLTMTPVLRLQKLTVQQRQALLKECPIGRTEVERMMRHARIEESLSGVRISKPSFQPNTVQPYAPPLEALRSEGGMPQVVRDADRRATTTTAAAAAAMRLSEALQIVPRVAAISGVIGRGESVSSMDGQQTGSMGSSQPRLLAIPGGKLSPAPMPQLDEKKEAQHEGPEEPSLSGSGDGEKESRIKAARSLLQQAHAEMLADAVRSRPGVSGLGQDPNRGTTGARNKARDTRVQKKRRGRAIFGLLLALLVIAAAGGGAYLFLLNGNESVDAGKITALGLEDVRKSEDRLQGVIADPRWAKMDSEARKQAVTEAFKQAGRWKIHLLVLSTKEGTMQAQVNDEGPNGTLTVLLPNVPKQNAPAPHP